MLTIEGENVGKAIYKMVVGDVLDVEDMFGAIQHYTNDAASS